MELKIDDYADLCDKLDIQSKKLELNARLIGQLADVLTFYADAANWKSESSGFAAQYDPEASKIEQDKGITARAVLAEYRLYKS